MSAVVLDTHAAVWYFLGSARLSSTALLAIEAAINAGEYIYLPSISIIEVIYLVEKGRLPEAALERLEASLADPDSLIVIAVLDLGVAQKVRKISKADVPDMPDRIIAATALHLGLPLITRDTMIQASIVPTIW